MYVAAQPDQAGERLRIVFSLKVPGGLVAQGCILHPVKANVPRQYK
jgi:hypothetical protein